MKYILISLFTLLFFPFEVYAGSTPAYLTPYLYHNYKDKALIVRAALKEERVTVLVNEVPTDLKMPGKGELMEWKEEAYNSSDAARSYLYSLRFLYQIELNVKEVILGEKDPNDGLVLTIVDHPDSMCPHRASFGEISADEDRIWFIYTEEQNGVPFKKYAWCRVDTFPKIKRQAKYDSRPIDPFGPPPEGGELEDPYDDGKAKSKP